MKLQRIFGVKSVAITIGILVTLALTACRPADIPERRMDEDPQKTTITQEAVEICVDEDTGTQMTYEEAVALAEAGLCTAEGALLETHTCNGTTGTWWLDLDIDQPGCAPACVVTIVDETTDINWRCTGALPEADASSEDAPAEAMSEEETTAEDGAPEDETVNTPVALSATEPAALPEDDWPKYAGGEDGFALRYPPTWTIELLNDRPAVDGVTPARAVMLTQDTLELLIEFKDPAEDVAMGPDNLAAGTVEERGTVMLFGRKLPKQVLVDAEQDKALFVGDRLPDLEIYVQLADTAGNEIPAAAQTDFDRILASFTRIGEHTDAYPGWATYASAEVAPGVGFTFRYRSDWTLTETQAGAETPLGPATAMAVLQRDTYVLRVQYKHAADETTMVAADVPDSMLMEAGTAWFLGRSVPRLVVVDGERLTHIFVSYADDALLVNVDLSQDPTIVADADRDLPVGIRNEMDAILGSFALITP